LHLLECLIITFEVIWVTIIIISISQSLQRQIEELERKHKVKATAVSFARRRRTIRNACKDEKGNEKNEVMNDKNAGKESSSEPNKDGESATLHADGTADENVPEK